MLEYLGWQLLGNGQQFQGRAQQVGRAAGPSLCAGRSGGPPTSLLLTALLVCPESARLKEQRVALHLVVQAEYEGAVRESYQQLQEAVTSINDIIVELQQLRADVLGEEGPAADG